MPTLQPKLLNMQIRSRELIHILKDWPTWPVLNAFTISDCDFIQLEQGLTNENWLVTLPSSTPEQNNQYVIRINAKNAEALNIHHQCELEIVQKVSKLNICPDILFLEPSFKYWIRPYIKGLTLAELYSNNLSDISEEIKSIAQTLKHTHSQIIQDHWPSVDTNQRNDFFWDQIIPNLSIHKQGILGAKDQLDAKLKNQSIPNKLCHMDTNIHNWIKNESGQLFLIDWEYSGLGNPIWDLAVFSDSAKLNAQQENELLNEYGEYSLQQLHIAKLQMHYLSTLWYAVQQHINEEELLNTLEKLSQQLI